jgi:hypothetical protein
MSAKRFVASTDAVIVPPIVHVNVAVVPFVHAPDFFAIRNSGPCVASTSTDRDGGA